MLSLGGLQLALEGVDAPDGEVVGRRRRRLAAAALRRLLALCIIASICFSIDRRCSRTPPPPACGVRRWILCRWMLCMRMQIDGGRDGGIHR